MKEIKFNELPESIKDKFKSGDDFISYVGVEEYDGLFEYTIKEISTLFSYIVNDENDTNPTLTAKIPFSSLSEYFHIPKVLQMMKVEIGIHEFNQVKEDVQNG